ncbi:MAG: FecR domain-containing protein [Planctomycetes bacterium]|nr:FecR domain-containing protein [Planctomycetota bacterium]
MAPPATPPVTPPVTPPAPAAPSTAPKVEPLPAGKQQVLQALVIGVDGRSEWRKAGSDSWKVAALNDLLDPGCEIRTGLRSTLSLRVGKDATLVIARSSRVELPVIVQDGAVLRTRAAVYRGKCDFKVEAVGVTSDFQVLTPSATLAVRGTGFSVAWGGFSGLEVAGIDTNRVRAIEVRYLEAQRSIFLSGSGLTSSLLPDPVQAALFRTVFPPPSPDRRVVEGGLDPSRPLPPPPLLRDFRKQQQIQHGGSEIGIDQKGAGQPGTPPDHG